MSSDSVNMSGAEGFFGLAPANKTRGSRAHHWFPVVRRVVKQKKKKNLEHVFDSHTLQRSKHAAGGRDTQALDYKPATE